MTTQVEEEPDLSHIHWSFPEAVAANPARSLATADLAMDYFAYSPFWDPKSNNNVLRVQRRIEQPAYGHAEEKLELGAFNSGFEYIVAHSQPPRMFLIHRRTVEAGGKRDKVDAVYWILNERIYPSPTLYDIVANRTKNAAFLLSETFSTLSALHPPSNPRTNNIWRSLPPVDPETEKRKPDTTGDIEMTNTSTETEDLKGKVEVEEKEVEEPDWNLYHALQSTRGAMGDLRDSARRPPPEEVYEVKGKTREFENVPRMSVNGSSTGTRTPGTRTGTLPDPGVHRALMIARTEGR